MIRWQYSVVNIGTFFAAARLGQTLSLLGQKPFPGLPPFPPTRWT